MEHFTAIMMIKERLTDYKNANDSGREDMTSEIKELEHSLYILNKKNGTIKEQTTVILLMDDVRSMLFAYEMHVNGLNGDEYGIPDNVEIGKFIANYYSKLKAKANSKR